MNATALLRKLDAWGPVLFGIGFVAPLIAQSLEALSLAAPFGLDSLAFGLLVGTGLGAVAQERGSWL